MSYCLPQEESKKLLSAIADGSFSPDRYAEQASTEARRNYMAQFVGESNAKEVNTLFESKMLLKDWKRGMITAIKKVTGLSEEAKREYAAKISNMKELLSAEDEKSFYADITEKKLGARPTLEEVKTITDLAKKAQTAKDTPTTNLSGVSTEYLKASAEMRSYIASLKPTSAIASIGKNAAIIARNNLLMNPSTPLKTSVGQIVNSAMDYVTRRVGLRSLGGLNYDLVRKANSEAWTTFMQTKMNVASMESLDDVGMLGEGKNFQVSSGMSKSGKVMRGVESAVRTVAKVSNNIAIDWEHNIPFTKFYQKAFYDMTNVFSSNIAKNEGLSGVQARTRAVEIFSDASRIKPKTDVGAMVRKEAQRNAARVTSTNDTLIGKFSLGVKNALNDTVTGLGDALMPIAKIPANIIWNGIENAGLGIPLGVKDIFQGRVKIQSEDLATRYEGMAQYSHGIQTVMRTVGVMSAAAFFASQLQKSDFKTDRYGADYVRIGGVWINMEYINATSPALAGMMEVKKTGKSGQGALDTMGQYVAGSLGGLKRTPGISEGTDLVAAVTNSNYAKGIQKYATTFFTQRGEPAFIRQLTNGETPIKNLFFSTTGLPTQKELRKLGAK